ncbi:hypothetical protein ACNQGP_08685 [Flavobacterium sp. GT2N3]|uniref:hypothetical protein n=1 Tax=unclassified Flavobacterium TaxID=196869 RepID=UPI003AAA9F19
MLFTGAGISINSGLPNWNHLIEKMLDGLGSKEEKSEKFKLALKDELFTPIEILNKKYNRNDLIKVCYINREISENKSKK